MTEKLSSNIRMLGYCDDWKASPGSTLNFKVSCDGIESYRAKIGRVVCADLDPSGPGFRIDHVDEIGRGPLKGRFQPVYPGSYARIDDCGKLCGMRRFSIAALVWPTLPGLGIQTILSRWDDETKCGWRLEVNDVGELSLQVGKSECVAGGKPMIRRQWHVVFAAIDLQRGQFKVLQRALREIPGCAETSVASGMLDKGGLAPDAPIPFLIAASRSKNPPGANRFFEGKIERPCLFDGISSIEAAEEYLLSESRCVDAGNIRASWDFALQMASARILDVSGNDIHGRLVNMPTRAVTGHNWNSSSLDWRSSPNQYGAIHFHADDIYDCEWETDFSWTVPVNARSGYYAAILEADSGDRDFIPFFLRPNPGERSADLAVIACTATYLAYANTHVKVDMVGSEVMSESVNQLSQYELYLHEHRELGHSTYDYHRDGSGFCYSSRLRPVLTMRPGPYTFNYINDTHLLAWLEHINQPYDVITDEDIDKRGVDALSGYRAIITLSHPEYTSTKMWDAFDSYQRNGGRHLYLGGNGFYWRVAFHDDFPGVLECRKGATGVRAWEGEPGEGHMHFSGEPGGLWRTCGRPPQSLVGVGYSSTMFVRSTYFRRSEESYSRKFAFAFEGVGPDEVIGDFGRRGGGAAGIEIDRWDRDLGSPPNSVILASSENVGIDGILSCEEYPIATRATDGLQHGHVRADMVFFETPNDGAVFSVGSITWVTSLSHRGFDNNVARITGNVLRQFLLPGPPGKSEG